MGGAYFTFDVGAGNIEEARVARKFEEV